ncbi:MAG TPA: hypothetical protein VH206_08225 [Xanthobacteraceae bacterium]|jgi:chemotaxis protein CheZ|nr:hypothetical protein [Xanthobacteraceae bacterium]
MPAPRKIFRIEESVAGPHVRDDTPPPDYHNEIMQALVGLRATLAAPTPLSAVAAPPALSPAQFSRIADELQAVVTGTAQATQNILNAAEEIDQLARNLDATLKGKIEQGAAQDISDLVVQIFEACNFQDLTGQHVAKVMARLKVAEADAARETPKPMPSSTLPSSAHLLHGPKLDNDSGHVTQAEIDALFDR